MKVLKKSARLAEEILFREMNLVEELGSASVIRGAVSAPPWQLRAPAQNHSLSKPSRINLADARATTNSSTSSARNSVSAAVKCHPGMKVASPWTVAAAKIARRENEATKAAQVRLDAAHSG